MESIDPSALRWRPIRIGGLYRCCVEEINGLDDAEDSEGDTLQCEHCKAWMTYRDGAWEWKKDK